MTLDDFKNLLLAATTNGSLLTAKHNPRSLGTAYHNYRTVLSHDLANNLESFLQSGNFSVKEFVNTAFPNSPLYFQIIPNQGSGFDIPSSGVTASSCFASSALDSLVVVSGQTSGLHVFGEDSAVIQRKLNNGDLIFKNNL